MITSNAKCISYIFLRNSYRMAAVNIILRNEKKKVAQFEECIIIPLMCSIINKHIDIRRLMGYVRIMV